jgi:hypothetical protein
MAKNNSGDRFISIVFWLLVADWLLLTARILMPERIGISRGSFLPHLGSVLVLGVVLGWLVLKNEGLKGGLRKWLLVTSGSAVGIFVGVILHNLLYAAAEVTKEVPVIHQAVELLSGGFFIVAIVVCPVGLVVGAVMSGREMRRGRRPDSK